MHACVGQARACRDLATATVGQTDACIALGIQAFMYSVRYTGVYGMRSAGLQGRRLWRACDYLYLRKDALDLGLGCILEAKLSVWYTGLYGMLA